MKIGQNIEKLTRDTNVSKMKISVKSLDTEQPLPPPHHHHHNYTLHPPLSTQFGKGGQKGALGDLLLGGEGEQGLPFLRRTCVRFEGILSKHELTGQWQALSVYKSCPYFLPSTGHIITLL